MKAEIKKLWLKALRSGKYHQGKGALKTERGSFCCLGVLCDLHAKATGGEWKKENGFNVYMGNDQFLPDTVRRWAGLKDEAGELQVQEDGAFYADTLAERNDEGARFKTIAALIEKHF